MENDRWHEYLIAMTEDERIHGKSSKVNPAIMCYTEDNPYDLRWRCDFDESLSLESLGDLARGLNEEDLGDFEYLRSLAHFLQEIGINDITDDGSSYIDFVAKAYPNPDGETYTYKMYFETEKGQKSEIYDERTDTPLAEDGLFQLDNYVSGIHEFTRVIEDGEETMDYRISIDNYEEEKDK